MKVKLKKMSLSPKETEDGEDEMSEDKDSGSRDEFRRPDSKDQVVGRLVASAAPLLGVQISELWLCFHKGHLLPIVLHFCICLSQHYTIAWILSHGSDHREFRALFDELDAQHGSMFCSTGLKWLSRGVVLRQFLELVEEIDFFMSSGGESAPQLTSRDFAFLVVIVTHLTMLAISLERHSQVLAQLYNSADSFLVKLCLWETHLAQNNLAHFPMLELVSENENDGLHYMPQIKELKTKFQKRFSNFTLHENELILFHSPLSIGIHNVNEELQMEVSELQGNTTLKAKYHDVEIPELYRYLRNGYPKYKHHWQRFCPC